MIPPDVANSLRALAPDLNSAAQAQQTRPVVSAQRIADILGDLVPGQRLMAEIQALLPNGSYRAVIAQRDVTLALPFSAKAGDSVELEVTESDGKVALAVVARQPAGQAGSARNDSVSTTLSNTGRMIGDLLAGIDDQGKRAAPAPLNGNQPLTETFSGKAADLAPLLKEALVKSGVFYEAHQARWVAGQLPTATLLQEPQGKHSSPEAANPQNNPPAQPARTSDAPSPVAVSTENGSSATATNTAAAGKTEPGNTATAKTPTESAIATNTATGTNSPGRIPGDLAPIVQQQLDALATQTFAWQGQVWPGQQMHWEIDDQGERNPGNGENTENRWKTRIKLDLPRIGSLEASLVLHPGNEVGIEISTPDDTTRATLSGAGKLLLQQFESAGLKLSGFSVRHEQAGE